MKGDFSRNTFKNEKHYSGVRMQQGRVQLDADWNEQVDIQAHLRETSNCSVIGTCGVSSKDAGFKIIPNEDCDGIIITKGNIYADGILCENESDTNYEQQPDFHGEPLPVEPALYMFYLDVWKRHITGIEDETIREVALNGADTATRTKTVWQVKYFKLPPKVPTVYFCGERFDFWEQLAQSRTARCSARVITDVIESSDLCVAPPISGFRGTENQLYRVEIHTPGDAGQATFKWSRDNGAIAATISEIKDNESVIIDRPAQDELHSFISGNWIEVTDDLHELNGTLGTLARVKAVLNGVEIVFDPATASDPEGITQASFPQDANPKVRRWDQKTTIEVKTSANFWIPLEDGIEVKFAENDIYRAGDYWLIPARVATGQIEWPVVDGEPALLERFGNEHHYCRLGILGFNNGTWEVRYDCRPIFSPLTEQINIFKISGDGQEALPGDELPKPLQVGVTNGLVRIIGAKVFFEVTAGKGEIKVSGGNFTNDIIEVQTDENGIAECIFKIDKINQSQQVTATLRDPEDPVNRPHLHLPVGFNANISRAPAVAFEIESCSEAERDPPSVHSLFCDSEEVSLDNWPDLDNNGKVTVQDALSGLLLFLDAAKLPFKHKVPGSKFPESLPQTVAAALDYLSHRIVPAGMIMAFANTEPPEGWLECNGQEISEDDFPDLYNALKDRFPSGMPVSVPNLQGEFIRGWDNDRGIDPGRNFGSMQFDQVQTHTHADTGHLHKDAGHTHSITDPGHRHLAPTSTGSAGDFEAAPTTQVGVDYIGAPLTESSNTGITVNSGAASVQSSNANLGAPIDIANVTVRPGPETRPRNVALMYCIKT